MEGLVGIIVNLVSGAVGGNLAGALMKNFSLGTLLNSVVGILGGGLGGQLLGMLGAMPADGGLAGILGTVGSGAVGGGVLMAVVGMIKKAMGGAST